MWVAQEGGSGCVPAVGSAVRCLRVIWSGRRRAVGGALSFHNTHASPAQNTVIGFEFGTNFVLIRSGDLELPQGGCTAAIRGLGVLFEHTISFQVQNFVTCWWRRSWA